MTKFLTTTPKGGQFSKNCPIRLPEVTKVDVVNEDDEGHPVVTHRRQKPARRPMRRKQPTPSQRRRF
jgi:hypothetical protein